MSDTEQQCADTDREPDVSCPRNAVAALQESPHQPYQRRHQPPPEKQLFRDAAIEHPRIYREPEPFRCRRQGAGRIVGNGVKQHSASDPSDQTRSNLGPHRASGRLSGKEGLEDNCADFTAMPYLSSAFPRPDRRNFGPWRIRGDPRDESRGPAGKLLQSPSAPS
jgi:hypothetical protein